MIEIKYDSPRVEKYFSDPTYNKLVKEIGLELTRATKKRIDQIKSAVNFQAYLQYGLGKPEHLVDNQDSQNCYSVRLTGNYRLIIKPEANDLSSEQLSNCNGIIIKGVCDYHGGKTNWILP